MQKKTRRILLTAVATLLLATIFMQASNQPAKAQLPVDETVRQATPADEDEQDSFVDEDGVRWYWNPDGYYQDYPYDPNASFDEGWGEFEESFVEDGVTWYLHDDGYYYDYPPSEAGDESWFGDWQDWLIGEMFAGDEEDGDTGKTPASPGEYPWQVALVYRDEPNAYDGQFCGGSLIAADWILTAAHCVEETAASEVDVVIGRDVLSSNAGERISAVKIVSYEGYFDGSAPNADIALIKLSRAATEGQVVALANNQTTGHLDDAGVEVAVSGWGVLSETAVNAPDQLHEAETSIVSNATCRLAYGDEIDGDALCAGEADGGKDSCSGDSGGPLVTFNSGEPVQVGIVSWGEGCGLAGYYGVYTRVTTFSDWINAQMAAG